MIAVGAGNWYNFRLALPTVDSVGKARMEKTDGVRLFVKLKSDRDGRIHIRTAAHIRCGGTGHLLLYNEAHRLTEAVSLKDYTVQQIMPVHWVREEVRSSAPGDSIVRLAFTRTVRLPPSSE